MINIWTYFEKFLRKISKNRAKYEVKKDLGQVLRESEEKTRINEEHYQHQIQLQFFRKFG